MAVVALVAIAVVTALVIAAWRFGGPEDEKVHGLAQGTIAGVATPKARGTARLAVRAANGSTWMEVRTAAPAGKLLYNGTLEHGQRKSFTGPALQLTLAKPDNVLVRVNGDAVELPAGSTFLVTAKRVTRAPS